MKNAPVTGASTWRRLGSLRRISVPFSSISLFAPTIVLGLGYEGLNAQLFTVPPYAIAFVVTVVVSYFSDKYEMRSWGTFGSFVVAGFSFLIQGGL